MVDRVYRAEGDCCSESWVADILGVEALRGGTVASVEDSPLEEDYDLEDGRCRRECDKVYGYRLVTDKGRADIIFRNSSNGYYGGWLNSIDYRPAGHDLFEIVDDWSSP